MVQVMDLQEKTQTKNKNISRMIKKNQLWKMTINSRLKSVEVKSQRKTLYNQKISQSFHIFQSNTHKSDLNSKLRVREKQLL